MLYVPYYGLSGIILVCVTIRVFFLSFLSALCNLSFLATLFLQYFQPV